MKEFLRKLQYNSPVTLTFAFLSLAILLLGYLTNGLTTKLLFGVYQSSWSDPLTYFRLFGHVLGHADWSHYSSNMVLFLVLGDAIDYHQYVKKTWTKKKDANNNFENGVSFSISKIENGKITGEIAVVNNDTAECQFTDSRGNKGNIKFAFKPNNEMEATIKLTDKAQDTIAQPPVGTFQFAPLNLKDIKGFSLIENQSFMVDLNSWGNVKFAAGKLTGGKHIPVVFYLTDMGGDILYNFYANLPYMVDVKAVSFEDVSNDGLKDIIIIVDDGYVGQGNAPIASVYFQKVDGSFANDLKLDQAINDSQNNKDIKTVKSYLAGKL